MMNIDDCLEFRVKQEDLHLGWIVSIKNGWICLSYTIRDFDWTSVENASFEKVNRFLKTEIYDIMKKMLEEARSKRSRLFYQARSISEMKQYLEADNVKLDIEKLVDAAVKNKSAVIQQKARKD